MQLDQAGTFMINTSRLAGINGTDAMSVTCVAMGQAAVLFAKHAASDFGAVEDSTLREALVQVGALV